MLIKIEVQQSISNSDNTDSTTPESVSKNTDNTINIYKIV